MGANHSTKEPDESCKLCRQYNLIHRHFRTTYEPYDELDFDGEELRVWLDGEVIEVYCQKCLEQFIDGFSDEPEAVTQ